MRALRIGEDVLARDGSRLGTVERIVVDEAGNRVTHLVVAGRAIPLARLRDAGPDGLAADLDRPSLQALRSAGDLRGPGRHWQAPAGFGLENFLAIAEALIGGSPYSPPVHADLGLLQHEITAGSPVWTGQRRLGEVASVVTDDSGALTEIVVRHGHLPGREVRIPISRVVEVVGNNVHVELGPSELEQLEREG